MVRQGLDSWQLTQPETLACDPGQAGRVARTLAYLRSEEFAGRSPVAGSGLDAPDSSVWFSTAGGDTGRLFVGAADSSGRMHVKKAASDVVYLISASRLKVVFPDLSQLVKQEEQEQE
jgi:hypothetical protein